MPMSAFRIERVTLAAATPYAATAPETCSSVGIANETGADILVSADQAGTEYVTLGDGLLLTVDLSQVGPSVGAFQRGQASFYLHSSGGGAVALLWV